MAKDKLLAEWFWTDRWNGSSAFLLPLEARGLYREMYSQALRLGGRLPNDEARIQRMVGASREEWLRAWPRVDKFWRVEGDSLAPIDEFGYTRPLPGQPAPFRPWIPMWVRRAVFALYGRRCLFCGSELDIQLDHVVPFSKGGPDTVENLRPLCGPCNRAKSNRCA